MSTWAELIADGAAALESHGLGEAEITAEYLAAHILGVWDRSDLRPLRLSPATETQHLQFDNLLRRRLAHEPVQYIIGETEFYGLRLYCTPAALIPRAETEILVEEAIKEIRERGGACSVLDIGTGSGAIALAIATHCPSSNVVGIDISTDAISLAKQNAKRLAITNIELRQLRFPQMLNDLDRRFDLLVSNPPYIPAHEMELIADEVRSFEPHMALTDNANGFSFYEAIAEHAAELLHPNGVIVVETEYKGAPHVREMFAGHGLHIVRSVNDLLGHERVVVANRP
ncbi:MAG: peptide chain release factor N(5)-glutamine methyltransferase [Bacteroidetes bacterium]|nr:peptide chain release factor N(5)-glutamine methyltransferase [Bacteroidota bacterium]